MRLRPTMCFLLMLTLLNTLATGAVEPFPLDKLPVSSADIGSFPYITLPDGYEWGNDGKGETRDRDHFPFWTGSMVEDVQGKLFMAAILTKMTKAFVQEEFEAHIEALVARLGGVKITKSNIPSTVTQAWGEDIAVDKSAGLGDVYNRPAETFVIRRANRAIWVHFTTDNAGGSVAVVEAPAQP